MAVEADPPITVTNMDDSIINYESKEGVTIVIPCRNEAHRISSCLRSLEKVIGISGVEIILVDDHSEDDTILKASQFTEVLPLKIISSHGTGKKEAILTALQFSNYDIILCTDADCEFHVNWLISMRNKMVKEQLDKIGRAHV